MEDFLIWWTKQQDCELLTYEQVDTLPDYLSTELQSRIGRAGRGRLWVANLERFNDISKSGIIWNDAAPDAEYCGESAGIVFDKVDYHLIKDLPGIITDTSMVRYEE